MFQTIMLLSTLQEANQPSWGAQDRSKTSFVCPVKVPTQRHISTPKMTLFSSIFDCPDFCHIIINLSSPPDAENKSKKKKQCRMKVQTLINQNNYLSIFQNDTILRSSRNSNDCRVDIIFLEFFYYSDNSLMQLVLNSIS